MTKCTTVDLTNTQAAALKDVTAGTQAAGKAVVADANANTGVSKVTELHIGTSGSETQVTSTAAELNILDGVTANATELNYLDKASAVGVQEASKAVVCDANVNQGIAKVTELHIGTSGAETQVTSTGAEINLLDGSSTANSVASKAVILDSGGDIQTSSNVGAAGTGVTATEYGDGWRHITRLAVNVTDAFTTADALALGDGYLVYTLPAGQIIVYGASLQDIALTGASAEQQTDTPDVGLGTTEATGAVATLDGTPAFENILTGQTWSTGTLNGTAQSAVAGLATPLAIADGGDHTIYLNIADTWADDTGADLTVDVTGVIVIEWSYMGNPA